jgi:hypothetical protein
MLTLTPLAYADPPDPTWLAGFWDDDDFDDVVVYITSAAGVLHTPIAGELRPSVLPGVLKPSVFQAAAAQFHAQPPVPALPRPSSPVRLP